MKKQIHSIWHRFVRTAASKASRRGGILLGLTLASSLLVQTAPAAVTAQGWWHYGEVGDFHTDSSGNNRRFQFAFSCVGGGNSGAATVPFGAGGPLGTTGYISTNALYWTPQHCGAAAMWNPWSSSAATSEWNPPPTNYAIECWVLPEDRPEAPNRTWFFASGSGDFSQPSRPSRTGAGGVYFVWDKSSGTPQIGAYMIGNASQGVPADTQIGDFVNVDFTSWMHVAVVNDSGTNTFYVNGVASGASTITNTIPNGNIFAGGSPGTTPTFRGYLDELRISTFAPGQFSTSDLLLRAAGPSILAQPQSASVWEGGAAPFAVLAAIDGSLTFQWQRAETNIPGATTANLYLPQVSLADSGAEFRCVLTASSIALTSSVATLTVVPTRTADVNFYRAAVMSEPSLKALFTVDNCLGTTLSNIVDVTRHGILEGIASYDGRTNRSFGQRALSLTGAGDVFIPNNPAFEFPGGNGTVEALVYVNGTSLDERTIFALDFDTGTIGYALQVSRDGSQLIYTNDSPVTLTFAVPVNLIGRLAHVALVIDNATNVTVIVDGQSLGTKNQPGFGGAGGAPFWIGALGTSLVKPFSGTIDELAIYDSALSLNTIQVHYSRFLFGTNVTAPSIVSQPGPRTIIGGAAPILKVQVGGTLPISYQWMSNGVPIAGANAATHKVVSGPGSGSVSYSLSATNDVGGTNSQPINLTFVAPPSPYSAAVAADRPIAYWRLGESAGPTMVNSAGYNDGTYIGTVGFGAAPVITTETDKAVDFAGNAGRGEVSNVPELNPAGPFSVEVWTRPNAGAGGIILSSQNRANSRGGYSIHANIFIAQYGIDLGAPNAGVTRYNLATVPVAGVPVHIVFTYDGVTGTFYVNGEKTSAPLNNFVNNTVAPLTIGKRSDNAAPWNGTVDEAAFYDYALSGDRVTNHWSFSWVPAAITQNPTMTNGAEGNSITLTAAASGYPNTYQWFKGGVALVGTVTNFDGSLKYPQGVTSTTLVISQATPADAAQYYMQVTNPLGNVPSGNASVAVSLDTTKPTVLSATALGTPNADGTAPNLVKVVFSKRIDPVTGADPSKYSIPGVTVTAVTLLGDARASSLAADWREAILVTSALTLGANYSVTVTGVKDRTVSENVITPVATPFKGLVLTQGIAYWDYYYMGPPSSLDGLFSNPNFPRAPMTNAILTSFDTGPITGNDLATKPAFGALGSDYGDSVSAWITPTVSGNYTFFLASDDSSRLFVSFDANPVNAGLVAELIGARNSFVEPGVDGSVSAPHALTAGVPYFVRVLHHEGGGNDYVRLAWRLDTDSTPAASLLPIPGAFLSALAPPPAPRFNPVSYNAATRELTISWTGTGTLLESSDLINWTPVPGNPSSPYIVITSSPTPRYYRIGP